MWGNHSVVEGHWGSEAAAACLYPFVQGYHVPDLCLAAEQLGSLSGEPRPGVHLPPQVFGSDLSGSPSWVSKGQWPQEVRLRRSGSPETVERNEISSVCCDLNVIPQAGS